MAGHIVLLDDEPGLAGRHEKMLTARGYVVARPQTLEDIRVLLDTGRASLIIHSCNKTKSHESLCCEISKEYPHLPTLHLETGNGISKGHRKAGVSHRVVGHLGPERSFINTVRTLMTIGSLRYRELVHQRAMQDIEQVDRMLQELDSQKLVYLMLEQMEAWTSCDNVFWLSPGDVDYHLNEMWKIKSLNHAEALVKPAEQRIVSLHNIEYDEVHRVLVRLSELWESSWRETQRPTFMPGHLVLPVFDPDSNKAMGYFVLVGPKRVKMGVKYWLKRFALAYGQAQRYTEARSLCYIDDVTELYNQRYLGLALDAEIGRSQRNDTPFSILFMDVDHFKKVNDDKGHLVGSAILRKISRILKKNIRNFDYGFRYGGDEYMLLLVNTNSEGARQVGERIRKEVENTVFEFEGEKVRVTLSIGVASFPEHAKTKEEIVALADKAMYHGKSKSRNIVFVAS